MGAVPLILGGLCNNAKLKTVRDEEITKIPFIYVGWISVAHPPLSAIGGCALAIRLERSLEPDLSARIL
jgi:hypothetical protein